MVPFIASMATKFYRTTQTKIFFLTNYITIIKKTAKLTASTCLTEAMQIRHTLAPGLQESRRYCAAFFRSTSLSAKEHSIKLNQVHNKTGELKARMMTSLSSECCVIFSHYCNHFAIVISGSAAQKMYINTVSRNEIDANIVDV